MALSTDCMIDVQREAQRDLPEPPTHAYAPDEEPVRSRMSRPTRMAQEAECADHCTMAAITP
jgi:hypothetical protein